MKIICLEMYQAFIHSVCLEKRMKIVTSHSKLEGGVLFPSQSQSFAHQLSRSLYSFFFRGNQNN